MQLLLERKQASSFLRLVPLGIGNLTLFRLWAKVECTDEEQALINRYNMKDALLVVGDVGPSIRRSVFVGIIGGLIFGLALVPVNGSFLATIGGLVAFVVVAAIYNNEARDDIYVRDILHGRRFRCLSIVALVKKEAFLQQVSNYFRQVLETAKHWDDREIIEIAPLSREEAKAEVLRAAA